MIKEDVTIAIFQLIDVKKESKYRKLLLNISSIIRIALILTVCIWMIKLELTICYFCEENMALIPTILTIGTFFLFLSAFKFVFCK